MTGEALDPAEKSGDASAVVLDPETAALECEQGVERRQRLQSGSDVRLVLHEYQRSDRRRGRGVVREVGRKKADFIARSGMDTDTFPAGEAGLENRPAGFAQRQRKWHASYAECAIDYSGII